MVQQTDSYSVFDTWEEAAFRLTDGSIRRCLNNRYVLLEVIGRGGFGEVWQAYDIQQKRDVAVKIMYPSNGEWSSAVARFEHEAQMLQGLKHPNILRFRDCGQRNGFYYLVTEYMPSGTLQKVLRKQGNLSLEKAGRYLLDIGYALDHLHNLPELGLATERGIHRDVKAVNVLMRREFRQDGTSFYRAVLSDFGLARLIAETMADVSRIGSIQSMAPEQFDGNASPASDVYALGVLLYTMLCGRPPFQGDDFTVRYAHKNLIPPPLYENGFSEYIPDLERLVREMLAKNADERPSVCTAITRYRQIMRNQGLTVPERKQEWAWETIKKRKQQQRPTATSNGSSGGLVATLLVCFTIIGGIIIAAAALSSTHVASENTPLSVTRLAAPAAGQQMYSAAFAPDSAAFVTTAANGSVTLWRQKDNKWMEAKTVSAKDAAVTVSFAPNGEHVAVGYRDGSYRLFAPKREMALEATIKAHDDQIEAVVFAPDTARLATVAGGKDKSIKIWDVQDVTRPRLALPLINAPQLPFFCVAFTNSTHIMVGDMNGGLTLWNVVTRQAEKRVQAYTGTVFGMDYNAKVGMLVTNTDPKPSQKAEITLWRVKPKPNINPTANTSARIAPLTFEGAFVVGEVTPATLDKGSNRTYATAFSFDGHLIAAAQTDGSVHLWETESGTARGTWSLNETSAQNGTLNTTSEATTVAFSPNGAWLVAGDKKGRITIWQLRQLDQKSDETVLPTTT